jgi:hypothetical protein
VSPTPTEAIAEAARPDGAAEPVGIDASHTGGSRADFPRGSDFVDSSHPDSFDEDGDHIVHRDHPGRMTSRRTSGGRKHRSGIGDYSVLIVPVFRLLPTCRTLTRSSAPLCED